VTRTKVARQPIAIKPIATSIERAHFAHVGISNSNFSSAMTPPDFAKFKPLKIYDCGKRLGIQARAAHQRTINLRLCHQTLNVVGLDAAAVEDANR